MPDGVLQWFDPTTDEASIVRGGRKFRAKTTDVESAARIPGARVHFDIAPNKDGSQAVNVTLREGRRQNRRQRRFGDLTGARRSDSKGSAPYGRSAADVRPNVSLRPMDVTRAWVDCLREPDIDTALALYAPNAVVHTDDGDIEGRGHLHAFLDSSPLLGADQMPDLRGEDGRTTAVWHAAPPEIPELTVRTQIEHGLIAEQWIVSGEVTDDRPSEEAEESEGPDEFPLELSTIGDIRDTTVDYAVDRLRDVIDKIREPVLMVGLKLVLEAEPARDRPARVQATIDVNGDVIRGEVAARDLREAADGVKERMQSQLRRRMSRLNEYRSSEDQRDPDQWRHGDTPTDRPSFFDRSIEERELVRHKTFAPEEMTPDEAVFDMEQLDFTFYLFTELATGQDAVIQLADDGSYVLTRLDDTDTDPGPAAVELRVADAPTPRLSTNDALALLDESNAPFVFFADADSGRGCIVYRRYDGHYGLITPG